MQNWKTILIIIGAIVAILLLSRAFYPKPKVDNQSTKTVTVTAARLGSIEGELPSFTEKFTELKTETLLTSNLSNAPRLTPNKTFKANYRGWLATTGEIFDQNISPSAAQSQIKFNTNSLIQGFSQGVVGMQVGEVRRIFIPSDLAYGESGNASIPPNSDIIFDVELLEI
jgi:FKBP-type peptidyl-prolyl cis-trans isomerase